MSDAFREVQLGVDRTGYVSRRDLLRMGALAGASMATWRQSIGASAANIKKKGKACILLWMQGGPSQFETFSPKPGHQNGGETKAIATSVPGIQIAESLPRVAATMKDICVFRSLTTKEGSHPRGTFLMHTSYLPTASVKHPTLGSTVAHQLGDKAYELPSFVRIGGGRFPDGAGLLGVDYDPFVLPAAGKLPDNTTIAVDKARFERRLSLLEDLEADFEKRGGKEEVRDHQKLYARTKKMIFSPHMEVFDLAKEPEKSRQNYGDSAFGKGCLLARRLIEQGTSFVEVNLGNWDTHDNNFDKVKKLCGELDQPYAALIEDLRQRGMLDSTLVIWMGEFGRTPRINGRSGRDHYPKSFNATLAGCGIRGGQVIGETSEGGDSIKDRPVSEKDFFRTICRALAIDADHENMSSAGRPIKIVDGGQVVKEAIG